MEIGGRIDELGRIAISAEMREALKVLDGTMLDLELKRDKLYCTIIMTAVAFTAALLY